MVKLSRSSIVLVGAAILVSGVAAGQAAFLTKQPGLRDPSQLRSKAAESLAAAVADPKWSAPRTSWGDPSIDGQWTSDDMRSVPMNRPPEFGTRQNLTPEEFVNRASKDEGAKGEATNVNSLLVHEYGVRTFGYTSLVIDPPDGRMPALTPAGEAVLASRTTGTYGQGPYNGVADFTLYDRCITRGPIGSILPAIYGNGVKISQSPGYVAITSEMIHETRLIRLGPAPIQTEVRQYVGSSRGYWDGDTLVVESGQFTDQASVGRAPNSDEFKLTERFTRVDPEMVEYVATIEDPVTLTAPYTMRLMLTSQPDFVMYEYNCHEGNEALLNALSGERAFDRQMEEALAKGLPPPERTVTDHAAIRNGPQGSE